MKLLESNVVASVAGAPRVWRPKWRLYVIEGALLGLFMISACFFVVLVEHPISPLRQTLPSPLARRAIIGAAMGSTAVCLIYSRWGRQSGALMNPAMTLCFLRMGRLHARDAAGYAAAQFIGGAAGVAAVALVARELVAHPSVQFAVTVPGPFGLAVAWLGEFAIAFLLVTVVMSINKHPRLAPYGGGFAGALVATYITIEAPLSGMSLNPARTIASALSAQIWTGWWIYLTAPLAGMLAAVELLRFISAHPHRLCGRLNHCAKTRGIFNCDCLTRSRS